MLKFVTYNVTLGHYYFNVGVKNQGDVIYFVSKYLILDFIVKCDYP